jgi:heme-degrading monooxygenase HmoA
MFARVITAQADTEKIGDAIDFAERQLPAAQQRPGFQGYQLLSNAETGKVMIISFWETCEQMEQVARGTEAGIHDEGIQTTGLTSLHLETYEVKLQA